MTVTDISGNDGSITTKSIPSPKRSVFRTLVSFWWVAVIAIAGIGAIYSTIMAQPMAVNPTSESITFEIDGKAFSIGANTGITVDIGRGNHTITKGGKEIGKFTYGWLDGGSLINPTMSKFVLVEVLYGSESYENKLPNNTIIIDGNSYTGPYKLLQDLVYMKKEWDYGVYEESPESVKIKGSYTIKKELFFVDDFTDSTYHDNEEESDESDDILPPEESQ